jgi:transposase
VLLLPPSLDEWLPAGHLVRFIADLVDEYLDLSVFHADCAEGRGGPPFDPRLMVPVLLLGYTTGVRSSRRLEAACTEVVAFRWLAAGAAPDFRAIARFCKCHLAGLGNVFVQALALCRAAGMVSLGRVALDGTKVRANASRPKAVSCARMSEQEKVLAAEVSAMLFDVERVDKAEDARFGKDRRGDELPEELRRRESRLVKICRAKADLEAEARQRAAAEAAERARGAGKGEEQVAERAAAGGAQTDRATQLHRHPQGHRRQTRGHRRTVPDRGRDAFHAGRFDRHGNRVSVHPVHRCRCATG